MLKVKRFALGPLLSNTYILYNDKFAVIIDPGAEADIILKFLELNKLSLAMVLLTHGHFDHVGGVKTIYEKTNTSVYIHDDDIKLYKEARERAAEYNIPVQKQPLKPINFLIGNEDLDVNGYIIRVFNTPGHTLGGLSFYVPSINIVFTGDLLFKGSVGRTDFEGSSFVQLSHSIRSNIYTLDAKCIVYPGHGAPTTVGEEKNNNEFVRFKTL